MTPREHLALDAFRVEEKLDLYGRAVAVWLVGSWQEDGACEGVVGVLALLPFDFCRIQAAFRYVRGEPMKVVRTGEPDDARDDHEVIARHFETPIDQILNAVFAPIADRFAEAAELREARAEEPDEMPAREMPAPAWVH
jgi:hypothetical protein